MPDEELLERIRGAASGITPRSDIGGIVRDRVRSRRRRRRAAVGGVAVAAAGVVAAAALTLVLDRDESPRPGPAEQTDAPSATRGDVYRPAGFLEDVLGGRAAPIEQRHHAVKGELFYATINWQPPGWDGPPFLAAIALERYRDGAAGGRFELDAADAFLDPLHEAAPVPPAAEDATVRGVTYLHPSGLAVSVLVCDCSGRDGAVLAPEPPASYDELGEVAGDESWVRDPD